MPKIEDFAEDIFVLPPLPKPKSPSQRASLEDFFVIPTSLPPITSGTAPLEDIFVADLGTQEQTLLEELFAPQQTLKQVFNTFASAVMREEMKQDFTFFVYPLSQFSELVKFVNSRNLDKTTFRFIIDTDYNLWFAPEGGPNNINIPAHSQLTGKPRDEAKCFAAGTITLDFEQSKLVEISNKSGDFTPDFTCLRHLLNILFTNEDVLPFALPEQLSILKLHNKSRENTYKVELSDLRELVKKFTDSVSQSKLQEQPKTVVMHTYTKEQQARSFQTMFFAHKARHKDEGPTATPVSTHFI